MISFLKKLFFSEKRTITQSKDTLTINNSYKLIENDRDVHKIVSDFDLRKERHFKIDKEKFGFDPSDNDVLWGVFQELYNESNHVNHKLLLNVEYQRGLLLQKEKKYKDAISQYSNGLFYLLNAFNYPLSPDKFKQDIEGQEIYKGQAKFYNKLIRCINSGNIDRETFILSASHSIVESIIKDNITSDEFLSELTYHLRYDFFNVNIVNDINFSKISILEISIYASKIRTLTKYFIKNKYMEELKALLHCLYLLGCLDEYLLETVSASSYFNFTEYKQKLFVPSKYNYTGTKIIYKSIQKYYDKFLEQYQDLKNKNLIKIDTSSIIGKVDIRFLEDFLYKYKCSDVEAKPKPLLNDKDYEMMDKYLL